MASIGVALFLVLLKIWASIETGSVAMLGSLADTALDLVASLVTFLGVRWAAMPADAEHRFGHGKAEALAALFQIGLIAVSAVGIGWRAVQRLAEDVAPVDAEYGIGVSVAAIAATLALTAYQRSVIRRTGSVAAAKARRRSSGHSRSISWWMASRDARKPPKASQAAMRIPKIGSAPVRPI